MSSAAEAVSTPSSDVWMTRQGEAPTCRSQARKGAHDKGRITEEPCEVETLMHGSKAEAGRVIPASTVTRRPTAQALWWCVAQCLWAAAHRERW